MKIPILMYHQIDAPPPRGTPLRGLIVSPSSFKWQMGMLRMLGYTGLSMRDLEPYLNGEKHGKVVGITFDDGYQNNVINALPVLKANGFTATCYGVSSMVGGTNAWDNGKVAQTRLMDLSDWQQWLSADMDVGSHTQTHADLNTLSDAEARRQISASKLALEQVLGCEVRHFCYPYGRFSSRHAEMASEAGYVTATTTQRGRISPGDAAMTLRRIMVARATNPVQFFFKVMTAYEDKRA